LKNTTNLFHKPPLRNIVLHCPVTSLFKGLNSVKLCKLIVPFVNIASLNKAKDISLS